MEASAASIFGSDERARSAEPRMYGEPPSGYRLPDATRLGPVRLQVSDLERSLEFYRNVLGMHVVRVDGARAELSAQGTTTTLVELNERAGSSPVPRRGRLGLYHFAILLPDRPALGRFVQHLGDAGVRAGAADHLVSEAFYLQDPDNLGIEVYADRPRATWRQVGRELMMATDPADVAGIVASAHGKRWIGMPSETVMGHVHLHVGTIEGAAGFFSEALGLDRVVWHYPGALFLSAGGYHHHLGTNTWAGKDATPAAEDEARLLEWTIELPNAADVEAVAASLKKHGSPVERSVSVPGEITTRDPWGTQIRVKQAA